MSLLLHVCLSLLLSLLLPLLLCCCNVTIPHMQYYELQRYVTSNCVYIYEKAGTMGLLTVR